MCDHLLKLCPLRESGDEASGSAFAVLDDQSLTGVLLHVNCWPSLLKARVDRRTHRLMLESALIRVQSAAAHALQMQAASRRDLESPSGLRLQQLSGAKHRLEPVLAWAAIANLEERLAQAELAGNVALATQLADRLPAQTQRVEAQLGPRVYDTEGRDMVQLQQEYERLDSEEKQEVQRMQGRCVEMIQYKRELVNEMLKVTLPALTYYGRVPSKTL